VRVVNEIERAEWSRHVMCSHCNRISHCRQQQCGRRRQSSWYHDRDDDDDDDDDDAIIVSKII